MINLYKNLLMGYLISGVGGVLAIIAVGYFLFPQMGILPPFTLALIYIVSIAMYFQNKANKKYRALLEIMTKTCMCEKFIDESQKALNAYKKLDKTTENTIHLNISAAYVNLGEIEKAQKMMDSIDPDKARGKYIKSYMNFTLAVNKATAFFFLNDAENCEKWFNTAKEILASPKFNPNLRAQQERPVARLEGRLYMLLGEYAKAEDIFEYDIESSAKTLQKVHANYFLGEIYLKSKRIDEAKNAFKYAVKKGGDTKSAALAKARLEEIK